MIIRLKVSRDERHASIGCLVISARGQSSSTTLSNLFFVVIPPLARLGMKYAG